MSQIPNLNWKVLQLAHHQRIDGVLVTLGEAGWIIIPGRDKMPISYCPCCDKTFVTARAAMLVADQMFPLPEHANANTETLPAA